jgi:hypothetical protein
MAIVPVEPRVRHGREDRQIKPCQDGSAVPGSSDEEDQPTRMPAGQNGDSFTHLTARLAAAPFIVVIRAFTVPAPGRG